MSANGSEGTRRRRRVAQQRHIPGAETRLHRVREADDAARHALHRAGVLVALALDAICFASVLMVHTARVTKFGIANRLISNSTPEMQVGFSDVVRHEVGHDVAAWFSVVSMSGMHALRSCSSAVYLQAAGAPHAMALSGGASAPRLHVAQGPVSRTHSGACASG